MKAEIRYTRRKEDDMGHNFGYGAQIVVDGIVVKRFAYLAQEPDNLRAAGRFARAYLNKGIRRWAANENEKWNPPQRVWS